MHSGSGRVCSGESPSAAANVTALIKLHKSEKENLASIRSSGREVGRGSQGWRGEGLVRRRGRNTKTTTRPCDHIAARKKNKTKLSSPVI